MAFKSKYTTAQMEELFDKINGITDGGTEIEVDTELSTVSENPVQNKVITLEINDIKTDVKDATDDVSELAEQMNVLSDKVDKVENNAIIWHDVE